MRIHHNPPKESWKELCARPGYDFETLAARVKPILEAVRADGDSAVRRFTAEFDGVEPSDLRVSHTELVEASSRIPDDLKRAIDQAKKNIETFHLSDRHNVTEVETMPGVMCWQKNVPIDRVGLYIPGGLAPLLSTMLMLGVPAAIAGCRQIVVCTPPNKDGAVHPAILYICRMLGFDTVVRAGGAQAIGALVFGTESVPKVDKIFGPGNQYVTMAKQLATHYGVAIDLPAGPSEALVLADESTDPEIAAADLLAQAEHGADSQVILVSTDMGVAERVQAALRAQVAETPRRDIAEKAIEHARFVVFENLDEGMEFVNEYAPEHLLVQVQEIERVTAAIRNAGAVFIGAHSAEAAGDYATGPNHTLPTGGYARSASGVSLQSFFKTVTYQTLSTAGLRLIAPVVETLAEAEGLYAHRDAMRIRRERLDEGSN